MSKYVQPAPGKLVGYKSDDRAPALQDECVMVRPEAIARLMRSKGVDPGVLGQIEKVIEEAKEIDASLYLQDPDKMLFWEYGDLLHAVMYLGVMLRIDASACLRAAYERNKGREWPKGE